MKASFLLSTVGLFLVLVFSNCSRNTIKVSIVDPTSQLAVKSLAVSPGELFSSDELMTPEDQANMPWLKNFSSADSLVFIIPNMGTPKIDSLDCVAFVRAYKTNISKPYYEGVLAMKFNAIYRSAMDNSGNIEVPSRRIWVPCLAFYLPCANASHNGLIEVTNSLNLQVKIAILNQVLGNHK